jgi:hypothetical protein
MSFKNEASAVSLFSENSVINSLGLEFDQHHLEFFGRDNLLFNQNLGQVLQQITGVIQDPLGDQVTVVDKTLDFSFHGSQNLVTPYGLSLQHLHAHEWTSTRGFTQSNTSNLVTHTPFLDCALGSVGD